MICRMGKKISYFHRIPDWNLGHFPFDRWGYLNPSIHYDRCDNSNRNLPWFRCNTIVGYCLPENWINLVLIDEFRIVQKIHSNYFLGDGIVCDFENSRSNSQGERLISVFDFLEQTTKRLVQAGSLISVCCLVGGSMIMLTRILAAALLLGALMQTGCCHTCKKQTVGCCPAPPTTAMVPVRPPCPCTTN